MSIPHRILDVDGEEYEVQLPPGYIIEVDETPSGAWSAKLWVARGTPREDWMRLVERPSGAIQYSDPGEKRKSTGTKSRVEAIQLAVTRLDARQSSANPGANSASDTRKDAESKGLTIGRVAGLLQNNNLLKTTRISPTEKKRILKACKVFSAALGAGFDVTKITQVDVDLFYAKTTGCKPTGAELRDAELSELGLSVRDLGVRLNGKVRRSEYRLRSRPNTRGLVSVSTAHNDIMAVSSALTKLAGAADETGTPYLEYNRLRQLSLGHGPGKQTEAVSSERAYYIMMYADAATEEWNRRKRENEGFMHRGGASSRHSHLRQVPIGAVRCIYRIAWHRAVRHEQILGLRVEDHLRSRHAVSEAIRNSRPTLGQESAKSEWAKIWSKHGCLFFAMEYAQKPGYDRVCPNDALLARELDRFHELRREQGLPETGPLFRYLGRHDRALDANVVREIIGIAEDLARDQCIADGHDPAEVFSTRVRPLHDVRTAVANRWDAMGWALNQNAAWLGCWSTNIKAGNAADSVYKRLNPHLVMGLAEGMKLSEAREVTGVADAAQREAQMEVPLGRGKYRRCTAGE